MNKLLDLMTHLSPEQKQRLNEVTDELFALAGNCKTPKDHRRVTELIREQGKILGWEG
jgi:hypothetical protein